MKKTSLKIMALAYTLVVVACGEKQKPEMPNVETEACTIHVATDPFTLTDTSAPNLTNINVAQANIDRFNRFWSSSRSSNPNFANVPQPHAFTINSHDFLKAHGFADHPDCSVKYHTRIYFGLDSSSNGMHFELYMLPVAGVEGELVTADNPGYDTVFKYKGTTPKQAKLFALELNAPCPNTCATSSRLKTQEN